MKAWRQKANQDPVRKEWMTSPTRSPKDVTPTRWGKLTKYSIVRAAPPVSGLLLNLLLRIGLGKPA